MEDARMKILKMIEAGQITADEGIRLLNGLAGGAASAGGAAEAAPPQSPPIPPMFDSDQFAKPKSDPQIEKWRRWWMIPMWVGIGFVISGATLMYLALRSSGVGFWFFCASAPFALGVVIAALAFASSHSKWIHIRVNIGREEWPHRARRPRNIVISFPAPLRVLAWFVRTFGNHIPAMQRTAVDDLLVALDSSASAEAPLLIEVNEGEGGERVQVFIG